ncbi:MAG: sulfotransferase, partial [Gammaproteobacteria bacterium]
PGWLNLGLALAADGALDAAIDALGKAASLDPAVAGEAWTELARCERRRGALAAAEAAYRAALAAAPPTAARWNALGAVQFAAGRLDDAGASFAAALALDAHSADAHDNLGQVAAARGDRAAAEAHFEQALACAPAHGAAWRSLAALEQAPAASAALATRLEAALATVPQAAPARAPMLYALGHLADRLGDYDRAYAAFTQANAARRATTRHDPDAQARFIDALIEVFDAGYFAARTAAGSASEQPVFIVGMPRSGTSLVEQVLASHPQVHGAGELTFFPELVQRLPALLGSRQPFPRGLAGADATLAASAEEYLALLGRQGGGAARVTDKMPYNFLYLGLIATLFPHARVIHCRREPMATCFSIFTHDLAGSHPYAYDLEELARAWAGYGRLMAHWQTCLPLALLEVDYEALVDDLASGARALTGFLGLAFDPACLDFHRSGRAVTTASQWQVRRPVYTEAKAHWRHYARHLEPLEAALAAARGR